MASGSVRGSRRTNRESTAPIKGGCREVGPGAGRPEMAQRQNEAGQTETIAKKADGTGLHDRQRRREARAKGQRDQQVDGSGDTTLEASHLHRVAA